MLSHVRICQFQMHEQLFWIHGVTPVQSETCEGHPCSHCASVCFSCHCDISAVISLMSDFPLGVRIAVSWLRTVLCRYAFRRQARLDRHFHSWALEVGWHWVDWGKGVPQPRNWEARWTSLNPTNHHNYLRIFKGFYTTWRLLSWNFYSRVLGYLTKRPKNRLLNWKQP
jgi:hypothetical protein